MIQRSDVPGSQRLFILGAGFSKPAGLPLATELLDSVLNEIEHLNGRTHLHRAVDSYLDYAEATAGRRPFQIDIEEFAAYLDYRHTFGVLGSDTWSQEGNRDQFLLRWGIGRVLISATPTPEKTPKLYLDFVHCLRPHDVVVTFNYDLLLENALDSVGAPYRRFPHRYSEVRPGGSTPDLDAETEEILILKMHGSIDWVTRTSYDRQLAYMERLQGREGVEYTRKRDLLFGEEKGVSQTRPLTEGPRPVDDPLREIEVIDDLDSYYASTQVSYFHPPFVLAPSEAKQLYGTPLRSFWEGLPGYGFGWAGVGIIGYSLPPADPYARLVLYELCKSYVMGLETPGWRIGPMSPICLVDKRAGNEEVHELRQRFRFLPQRHVVERLDGFDQKCFQALFAEVDYKAADERLPSHP